MSAILDPFLFPETFGRIRLSGRIMPGVVTEISGADREYDWQVNKPQGGNGASTDYKGEKLAEEITVVLVATEIGQFAAFDSFRAYIAPVKGAAVASGTTSNASGSSGSSSASSGGQATQTSQATQNALNAGSQSQGAGISVTSAATPAASTAVASAKPPAFAIQNPLINFNKIDRVSIKKIGQPKPIKGRYYQLTLVFIEFNPPSTAANGTASPASPNDPTPATPADAAEKTMQDLINKINKV